MSADLRISQGDLDAIENQARINDLAEAAKAATGKSLKERLARLIIGWAGPSMYGTNSAAAASRYVGQSKWGDSEFESPKVPSLADGGNYVGDVFAPCQPGIDRGDHERVIREWTEEEDLSEALHAGGAFDVVLRAARTMTARRILKVMESVAEDMRLEGDVLWVGKRTRAAVGDDLIRDVKPELMEAIRGKETASSGTVRGVRAANGTTPIGAADTAPPAVAGDAAAPGGGQNLPGSG